MAAQFQPKFVDLVRNYSSTVGTADFVLGPAANGYTDFSAALQAGDSFYYSATGVDNPAETEVGRGTLSGTGTISRDPIGGIKTDFSSGTKSIALIAAAEWFARTDAAAAQSPTSAASRSALAGLSQGAVPALLAEAGREGLFAWDGSNLSGAVASDPRQALFVAPASDPSGASGAWVRKFSGAANARWFGAKGDASADGSGGADDTAAIQAALDYLDTIGGGTLYLPEGTYMVSSNITVPTNVVLKGAGRKACRIVGTHAGGGGANPSEDVRNGSIFTCLQQVNVTNATNIQIETLCIDNSNPSNQGAGFYQQSGDTIRVRDCAFTGSKYGIILDQSEDVAIAGCELGSGVAGGAGLWIVNGWDLNPVASAGFSNVISVRDCHINIGTASYGVVDDGGEAHIYDGCDFNGGVSGLHLAVSNGPHTIRGCYFEAQTSHCAILTNNRLSGGGVGGGIVSFDDCRFLAASGKSSINVPGYPGTLIINGGIYHGGGGTCPITGGVNLAGLYLNGPSKNAPAATFADAPAAGAGFPFVDLSKLTMDLAGNVQVRGLTSAAGGVGYTRGAGGAVTQATSKSTAVTLNKACGQVTMNAETLAAGATVSFAIGNSTVAATDAVIANVAGGGTANAYRAAVTAVAAGSFTVTVENITAEALSEAPVIAFAVLKAAAA